jgi:hypothetical protein
VRMGAQIAKDRQAMSKPQPKKKEPKWMKTPY